MPSRAVPSGPSPKVFMRQSKVLSTRAIQRIAHTNKLQIPALGDKSSDTAIQNVFDRDKRLFFRLTDIN